MKLLGLRSLFRAAHLWKLPFELQLSSARGAPFSSRPINYVEVEVLNYRDGPGGSHGKEGLGPIPEVTRTGRRGNREGSEARTSASGTPPARSSAGCRQLVRQLARTGCFEVRLAGGMARKEDGFFFARRMDRRCVGVLPCVGVQSNTMVGNCKEVLLTPKMAVNFCTTRRAAKPRGRAGHPAQGDPWYGVVKVRKVMYRVHMVRTYRHADATRRRSVCSMVCSD